MTFGVLSLSYYAVYCGSALATAMRTSVIVVLYRAPSPFEYEPRLGTVSGDHDLDNRTYTQGVPASEGGVAFEGRGGVPDDRSQISQEADELNHVPVEVSEFKFQVGHQVGRAKRREWPFRWLDWSIP